VLPDVLRPGLRVVFCGTAASTASAQATSYYAGAGNKFWSTLHEIGLTPRLFAPGDYASLSKLGIGLTDIVKNQSGVDREIRFAGDGAAVLRGKVLKVQPTFLAFNGKRAAKEFLRVPKVEYGLCQEMVGTTRLYVLPSTAGNASGYWDIGLWHEFAGLLAPDTRSVGSDSDRNALERAGTPSLVWDEWGRITRFFESSRIALAREAVLWNSLELADPKEALVRVTSGTSSYQVSLEAHAEAVSDTWFLYASALVSYFALAESVAADELGLDDLVGMDGIADWGGQLLRAAKCDWRKVHGNRIGAIEVAVVRNLIAHGDRSYSKRAVAKLRAGGMSPCPEPGDPLVLDDQTFREYRSRLKSLLNRGLAGSSGEGGSV